MLVELCVNFEQVLYGESDYKITNSLQKLVVVSLSKQGCVPKRGTDTANLQLLNTLETARDDQCSHYE